MAGLAGELKARIKRHQHTERARAGGCGLPDHSSRYRSRSGISAPSAVSTSCKRRVVAAPERRWTHLAARTSHDAWPGSLRMSGMKSSLPKRESHQCKAKGDYGPPHLRVVRVRSQHQPGVRVQLEEGGHGIRACPERIDCRYLIQPPEASTQTRSDPLFEFRVGSDRAGGAVRRKFASEIYVEFRFSPGHGVPIATKEFPSLVWCPLLCLARSHDG